MNGPDEGTEYMGLLDPLAFPPKPIPTEELLLFGSEDEESFFSLGLMTCITPTFGCRLNFELKFSSRFSSSRLK